MLNPYRNVNWADVHRVPSTTHLHCKTQKELDNAYARGIRHFSISNYYPSAPYNAETRISDFWFHQTWGVPKRDGEMLSPPIDWTKVITWKDELDEEWRNTIPTGQTEPVFSHIPSDVILSNNAEHHGFADEARSLHVTSPGSTYCSGNINAGNRYHLLHHGFFTGFGGSWRELFEDVLGRLDYPDGGGIVINHPTWFSNFSDEFVMEMLDFDPRVLGIEIYNHSSYGSTQNGKRSPDSQDEELGFSLNMWDRILATGRVCLGFSVPDHHMSDEDNWLGMMVLLVPECTDHECLRAFRNGNFYSCLKNNGLSVMEFAVNEQKAAVRFNANAGIRIIADGETVLETTGDTAEWNIPQKQGKPAVTYLRVEASDDTGERLLLQPVMMKQR
ncbi:MAG: hypothetical protein JW849_07285 [Phycisphaerae bacterium]|nr:hypothetical protein [Phycisphaerae bacterium]